MTERAMVFEALNIGVEATPGTEADANRRIEAWSLAPSPQGAIDSFRPDGSKFATLATVGKRWTEAALDGVLSYSDVIYILSGLVSYGTPGTSAGTPPAYTWTFTPDTDGPDTVKTYTIERGSSVRAHQFEYGQFSGFGFSFNATDSQVSISGDVLGQELRDGITMTTTPTTIEAVPASPKDCTVKLASTQAGISGATALTRVLAVEWNYTGKYGAVHTVSTDVSYVATVELAGELTGSLTLEADSSGMGFLTQAAAGTQYWIEILFTGAIISGTDAYKIQIQMPIVFTNFGDISDSDGVVAVQWQFAGVHDATWTKALEIVVVNATSALS